MELKFSRIMVILVLRPQNIMTKKEWWHIFQMEQVQKSFMEMQMKSKHLITISLSLILKKIKQFVQQEIEWISRENKLIKQLENGQTFIEQINAKIVNLR